MGTPCNELPPRVDRPSAVPKWVFQSDAPRRQVEDAPVASLTRRERRRRRRREVVVDVNINISSSGEAAKVTACFESGGGMLGGYRFRPQDGEVG